MMNSKRSVLIVGNYRNDGLQSMERYAKLLVRIYQHEADVVLVRPHLIVGRIPGLPSLIRKYLAYIDKLLCFPLWLAVRARSFDLVHIADHSNGFYSFCCARNKCIVTCHDLLAVRGARGDHNAACTASPLGLWLQLMIMAGLRNSGRLIFVSEFTLSDYQKLGGGPSDQIRTVIPNPLNATFSPQLSDLALETEESRMIPKAPFLLMVGSGLPRKNRNLALRLLEELGELSPYHLVFAGAPLGPVESTFRHCHYLGDRLISVVRPSHNLLNHLYCKAHALLFPSLSEGFGWPLIEAQACNCPVIASTTTSIPEIAGSGALYAAPNDVKTFGIHVRKLEDHNLRTALLARGRTNLQRFSSELIARSYRQFAFKT
jgi:glycosyltransferase involved in cell wall biosynthesis